MEGEEEYTLRSAPMTAAQSSAANAKIMRDVPVSSRQQQEEEEGAGSQAARQAGRQP